MTHASGGLTHGASDALRQWRAAERECLRQCGMLRWQRRMLRHIERGVPFVACSLPRANGKSLSLGQHVLPQAIRSDGFLHRRGTEALIIAASMRQGAITLGFLHDAIGTEGFRWRKEGVTNRATGASVRLVGSDGRRSQGLGAQQSLIVCDEPGAWQPVMGELLWQSVRTAMGKAELRVVLVGTKAPAAPGSWWPELLDEGSDSARGRVVEVLDVPADRWDDAELVERANPGVLAGPWLRPALERELVEAKHDGRAKRAWLQYRCNALIGAAGSQELLTAPELDALLARPAAPREGSPIVAIDMGATESWNGWAAVWPNGRIEVGATAPRGTLTAPPTALDPGPAAVESRDAVVTVAEVLAPLFELRPAVVLADNFRSAEVEAACAGRVRVEIRTTHKKLDAAGDVSSLRRLALDDAASVGAGAELLRLGVADSCLSATAEVAKRQTGRDDCVRALLLAAGARARMPAPVRGTMREPIAVAWRRW